MGKECSRGQVRNHARGDDRLRGSFVSAELMSGEQICQNGHERVSIASGVQCERVEGFSYEQAVQQ